MNLSKNTTDKIPISVSLQDTIISEGITSPLFTNKRRLLVISMLAVGIGALVSIIAKLLVHLIDLITNLSFFHRLSLIPSDPATNEYGLFVIIVPVIGGLIVGLIAYYGSKAIRGHGIPEAMEQVLLNKSKIRPAITYLKPLSSAISIGTGGPFGAEGPIIATGGALGSTIGQMIRISHYERKILLAAGATAGMSAIFGSPIAAIFLAIELLLFEFSPSSILPVALACITGAAGHQFLFSSGPVFHMPAIAFPSNEALAVYSAIGLLTGVLAAFATKLVYLLEDLFEKIPLHWMWWPAIGGIAVGVIGYFAPRTLGVGYYNITDMLAGQLTVSFILSLCLFKFASWSIALASGTSGGTLAPLLTIGAAAGCLFGHLVNLCFPSVDLSLPLASLIGMSAMFAGASRALLTSVIFALETTRQSNALLPLLAACIAAYFVSLLLLKNSIMTEKIARRGVRTPQSYEPDPLDKIPVREIAQTNRIILDPLNTLQEVRPWLKAHSSEECNYYIVASANGNFKGIISSSNLFSMHHPLTATIGSLIKRKPVAITEDNSLRTAAEAMARENVDVLPVVSRNGKKITGILSYQDILRSYGTHADDHRKNLSISLKRRTLKILTRMHTNRNTNGDTNRRE